MNRLAWTALLLVAVAIPCLAQDDGERPRDDGWQDGEHRDPGHEMDHPRDREPRDPDDMDHPPRQPRGEGRDGREEGGPHPPMAPRQLSDEEVAEVMEFLRSWDPYRVQRLDQVRDRAPHEYMRTLQEAYFEMKRVQEMQKTNPEAYEEMRKERELERNSFQLGERIRKTEDAAEKDKLKAELRPILAELFDLREKHKDEEMKRLEEDLKRLREQVEKRRKNKESIVERRLLELSGEPNDDW